MPHDYAADVEPVETECPTCGQVRRIDAADEPPMSINALSSRRRAPETASPGVNPGEGKPDA